MSRKIKNILFFDNFQQHFQTNSAKIVVEGDGNMQEYYLKSLQMIKDLKIKTEEEYNKLASCFKILSLESIKYISQTRNFNKIIKLAEEV